LEGNGVGLGVPARGQRRATTDWLWPMGGEWSGRRSPRLVVCSSVV